MNNEILGNKWASTSIKRCCISSFSGGTPDTTISKYWDGDIPWIASGMCHDCNIIKATRNITIDGMNNSSTKLIPRNTPVIAMTGATCGNTGYLTFDSCANQSVYAFITNQSLLLPRYVFYSLQAIRDFIIMQQTGGAQGGISGEKCKNFPVLLPPLDEQHSIVETLDIKISQIDKLIANQEKQIEKLNEYKQSVITKAVTKGLDLNVEMKDSGVEWIGKYNSNYQIIKMKKITYMKGRIGWQGLTSSDFIDEGPYCITGTDFYNGKVDWSRCYHVSNERYNMDEKIQVKVGDLLITKDGTIGKLAIIDELPNKACLNSHLLIIRPLNNMFINEYLYYVLSSKIFVKYYSLIGSGKTTMNSLSQEQIGDFSFPCPSIDEQLIIANYLSNKCLKINSLLNIKKNKIYKLNEYKKSLIYEYVTGKKQVA